MQLFQVFGVGRMMDVTEILGNSGKVAKEYLEDLSCIQTNLSLLK